MTGYRVVNLKDLFEEFKEYNKFRVRKYKKLFRASLRIL